MIEVFTDGHSGVHFIELNEDLTLHFGGKDLYDLSGWTLADNHTGIPIHESETWENSNDDEIMKDINSISSHLQVKGSII